MSERMSDSISRLLIEGSGARRPSPDRSTSSSH